jgi:excisionase family DNA binding protein
VTISQVAGLQSVSTYMRLSDRTTNEVRYEGVRCLADILDFHPKTIERMARTGRIPASRIGSRWRFRLDDIESWLAERSL